MFVICVKHFDFAYFDPCILDYNFSAFFYFKAPVFYNPVFYWIDVLNREYEFFACNIYQNKLICFIYYYSYLH